jgi:hypothetical protein
MTAWTERQWQKAMRAAGWRNAGQGCWLYKKPGRPDAKFYAWTVTKWRTDKYGNGEAWYEFALNKQIPTDAPF